MKNKNYNNYYVSIRGKVIKVVPHPGFHNEFSYWKIPGMNDTIHNDHVFTTLKQAKEEAKRYNTTIPTSALDRYNISRAENDKLQGFSKQEILTRNVATYTQYEEELTYLSDLIKSKNDKLSTPEALIIAATTIKYFETIRERYTPALSHFHFQLMDDLNV